MTYYQLPVSIKVLLTLPSTFSLSQSVNILILIAKKLGKILEDLGVQGNTIGEGRGHKD